MEKDFNFNLEDVEPYYLLLMNLNFLNPLHSPKSEWLLKNLKELGEGIEDEVLVEMLNYSWRSSKVAAWVISVSNKIRLVPELEASLKRSIIYSEHLLMALLIIRREDSYHTIKEFAQSQLAKFHTKTGISSIDRSSIDWAIACLKWIEEFYSVSGPGVDDILKSQIWVNAINDAEKYRVGYVFKIDRCFNSVKEGIQFIDDFNRRNNGIK